MMFVSVCCVTVCDLLHLLLLQEAQDLLQTHGVLSVHVAPEVLVDLEPPWYPLPLKHQNVPTMRRHDPVCVWKHHKEVGVDMPTSFLQH